VIIIILLALVIILFISIDQCVNGSLVPCVYNVAGNLSIGPNTHVTVTGGCTLVLSASANIRLLQNTSIKVSRLLIIVCSRLFKEYLFYHMV
jgi:hypothetical protein